MNYPLVSVILIHYNRINHLKSTLNTLIHKINYPNLEIIIADDFSKGDIRNELLNIKCDILILNQRNYGLGKNTNNAIKVCSGDYILQLQDDWDFIGDSNILKKSIDAFEKNPNIEMIRYYNVKKYPITKYNKDLVACDNEKLNIKQTNILYSDTPHLKKKFFHEKYGLYQEGVPMTEMELKFSETYKEKRTGIVLFSVNDQFVHTGADSSFNPSQKKKRLYKKFSKIKILKIMMDFYLNRK